MVLKIQLVTFCIKGCEFRSANTNPLVQSDICVYTIKEEKKVFASGAATGLRKKIPKPADYTAFVNIIEKQPTKEHDFNPAI